MKTHFHCVQLLGANFDVLSETLRARVETEHGLSMFFSSLGLAPSIAQVRQWCSLSRAAPGHPVDCMVWAMVDCGEGVGFERRPLGGVRIVCETVLDYHWKA